jgi:hypothetical protein
VDEKQAQAQAPAIGSGTAWVSGQNAQRSQLGPNQGIVEGRRAAGEARLGHVTARSAQPCAGAASFPPAARAPPCACG